MDGPAGEPRDESIGDLIGRLVEDGRAYAEAELALVKAVAAHRGKRARRAMVSLGAGSFLIVSSTTALLVGAVLGLSQYMSPFLAGLLVGALVAGAGAVLTLSGWRQMRRLGQDPEEREALERGTLP